jgi:FemAB-related protein (PEP-CTERM system-associated)
MMPMPAVRTPLLRGDVCVRADVEDVLWNGYVDSHTDASAYHVSGWARLVAETSGHEARLLACQRNGRITGILPLVVMRSRLFGRFVVSLPLLNAGGVLADDRESANALLAAAIDVTRETGAEYLELRHTERRFPQLVERRHKVAMSLALQPTVDQQWQALDRKLRNQVRKAEKSGLRAADGGADLLEDFYHVFARNMRDLGTPVFGRALFESTLRRFAWSTRVCCVYAGQEPVAAAIVHWRNGWMEVPWASALRAFNPQCANVFLYWNMLRFAIAQGCRTFEFGRCTPDEGPFHFKRQWGAEPSPLVWEYWTPSGAVPESFDPRSDRHQWKVSIWQRLPLPVATALGPRIVRGIPC